MTRDTGFAWSARSRAVDVLFHLPSLIRLYWRLFRDPRVYVWPKTLLVGELACVALTFDLIHEFILFVGVVVDLSIVVVEDSLIYVLSRTRDVVHSRRG